MPGEFGYSDLKLFLPKFRGQAKTFAWMTGPGVYYGDIELSGAAGPNSVTTQCKLLPYEKDNDGQKPLSMILTEFHVLLLYSDR